ncbi:MAG TPA: hypothetical protein VI010_15850 [Xanthobacteraceae bacterium]|jgi:hypothetical protein
MRRALIAVLLAGAVAVSTTKPAEARWGWGWGWGIGAFAIGALLGAALWRPAYSYYYPAYSYGYGYPAYGYGYGSYGYGYGYPSYGYGYTYPSYYYGGYYRPYYRAWASYRPSVGYRVARRSSPVALASAKKNSVITLAGAQTPRVNGAGLLVSSPAPSPRAHAPKRVQGRFATGGSMARNPI